MTKLLIFIGISYVLLKTPVVGKYVAVLNTLIHEAGHALVALLTGGRVVSIELHANAEGLATTQSRYWIGRVLTSLAGYPFASGIAFLFLYCIHTDRYITILGILAKIIVLSVLWWFRNLFGLKNLYGILWLLSVAVFFYFLYTVENPAITENIILFLTAIVFTESLRSSFVIAYLSFKTPKDSGDATSLYRATLLPAQLWGIFFLTQALVFSYFGITLFL